MNNLVEQFSIELELKNGGNEKLIFKFIKEIETEIKDQNFSELCRRIFDNLQKKYGTQEVDNLRNWKFEVKSVGLKKPKHAFIPIAWKEIENAIEIEILESPNQEEYVFPLGSLIFKEKEVLTALEVYLLAR